MSAARKKQLPVKLDNDRLDGHTISVGCMPCPLLKECGGYTRRGGGWSCMDRCAGCDPRKCDLVCLKKPSHFARALLEVGGFGLHGSTPLLPPPTLLPRYVPVFQHPCEARVPLEWAAVPFTALMRVRDGRYGPIADTPSDVRSKLGLAETTRILVLGTGKDRHIESYWRWRRKNAVPSALANLGFECAVSPNYSLFLEDPRPQHMFNRKRSVLCAAEWSQAGLPAIQYMQAVSAADWLFWRRFLEAHPEVTTVAKEFQTGLANPERAQLAIDHLARLQDVLKRPLHLVAIGGARFRSTLRDRFQERWTILDSVPFMKAIKWRSASHLGRRVRWERAPSEMAADLVLHNASLYSRWIARSDP